MAGAAALLLLSRRRDSVVAAGVLARHTPSRIADTLQRELSGAIASARMFSRASGLERLDREAARFGLTVTTPIGEVVRDLQRGKQYAGNLARNWLDKAKAAPGTVRQKAAAANAGTLAHLQTIGVTESSEAFNSGRAKALSQVDVGELLRVWDAKLDACPVCKDADGTIVGATEPFPKGEPGAVHARCQCTWHIIGSSRRDASAKAPEPRAAPIIQGPAAPKPAAAAPPLPKAKPVTKPRVAAVTRVRPFANVQGLPSAKAYQAAARKTQVYVAEDSAEARALRSYVSSSGGVNHYLRDVANGGGRDAVIDAEVAKIQTAMREVASRGGAVRGTVLRGEVLDLERFELLQSQQTLDYSSFVSTTTSAREAAEFAGAGAGHRAFITIEGAEGVPLGGLGVFGKSKEVLLGPGKFRVIDRTVSDRAIHLRIRPLASAESKAIRPIVPKTKLAPPTLAAYDDLKPASSRRVLESGTQVKDSEALRRLHKKLNALLPQSTHDERRAVERFTRGYDQTIRGHQRGLSRERLIENRLGELAAKKAKAEAYGVVYDTYAADVARAAEHIDEGIASVPHLESFLEKAGKATKAAPKVFRGLSLDEATVDKILDAGVIDLGGQTTSFSWAPSVASDFAATNATGGKVAVLLQVKHKSGVAIETLSQYSIEKEVLLPGSARFKIKSVRRIDYSDKPVTTNVAGIPLRTAAPEAGTKTVLIEAEEL